MRNPWHERCLTIGVKCRRQRKFVASRDRRPTLRGISNERSLTIQWQHHSTRFSIATCGDTSGSRCATRPRLRAGAL